MMYIFYKFLNFINNNLSSQHNFISTYSAKQNLLNINKNLIKFQIKQ